MKRFLSFVFALGTTTLCAQNNTFTVEGKLLSMKVPAKAYLQREINGKITLDSTTIQNGNFSFKGTVNEPALAYVLVDKAGTGFSNRRPMSSAAVCLEPGTILISSPDSLENAVLGGTPLNKDYQELATMLKPSNAKMVQLMKEIRSATPEQKASKTFGEAITKRNEAITNEQKKIQAEFIKEHPNSLVSMEAIFQYGGPVPDYAQVSPLYDGLSESVKASKVGKEYAQLLSSLKSTAIGAIAPNFTLADTSDKAVALNSFRGKYVLIDFWASWCLPCRAENPNVVKNYHQFKDRNFTVLGVSLDRPGAKEAWLNAIHKDGLAWTQVSDLKYWNSEVVKLYGVRAIPQNFLIDPSGRIVAKNIRGDALSKKLTEVLPTKP